jgi:UDP-N-acetylenolpyruvoylglucosamine reductase
LDNTFVETFSVTKKNTIFEKLKKYAALFQLPADNQSNATAEQILGLKKMISHRVFNHHTIVRKYV